MTGVFATLADGCDCGCELSLVRLRAGIGKEERTVHVFGKREGTAVIGERYRVTLPDPFQRPVELTLEEIRVLAENPDYPAEARRHASELLEDLTHPVAFRLAEASEQAV